MECSMGKPAARVADPVQHPLPPVLTPTTGGSLNVLIGGFPAWRGLPAASAAIIQEAKLIADEVVQTAEAATKAAAALPPPAESVAYAAEQATKIAVAASMSGLIASTASAAAATAAASGSIGVVDLHTCATLAPLPPHGPGVVIDGSSTVLINGLPACFEGNTILEPLGPPNKIVGGCATVLIGTGASSSVSVDISGVAASIKTQAQQAAQKVTQEAQNNAKLPSAGS